MSVPVQLNLVSTSPHTSIIITGLLLLAERGEISLSIVDDSKNPKYPHMALVEIQLLGRTIAFDLLDGYNWHLESIESYLSGVDKYFKRSFARKENGAISETNRTKIYPLGLSYHVTYPGNPIDCKVNLYEKATEFVKRVFRGYDQRYFVPAVFEEEADGCRNTPQVLFMTRLWDPAHQQWRFKDERESLNEMRVAIVKELKKRLGPIFVGGIAEDPYAKHVCPELIVSRHISDRRKYIELMKRSDICIGSAGLHRSIGWKTGEYVAASRAVVDERFYYEVPGCFKEGQNYLAYSNSEECLCFVERLLGSPQKVSKMKRHNQSYYDRFVKPDQMVLNAITTTCGSLR